MQETVLVRARPLSGPPSRNHLTNAGGFRGAATERAPLSSVPRNAATLPLSKPPLGHSKQLEGVRQLAAATPLAASRSVAAGPASARTTPAASAFSCVASLPRGVTQAVAGTACSLLLRTIPPSDATLNWEVSLVSYSDESQPNSAQSAQQRTGLPVAFALGACSGGVQSCSFVAAQAGTVVCKARVRGCAAAPAAFSLKVVACAPSARASSICLVHPLPSVDTVEVGAQVTLRLMVRARLFLVDCP
jgi:hypothetical protein